MPTNSPKTPETLGAIRRLVERSRGRKEALVSIKDGDLADSIIRKIAADDESCILMEDNGLTIIYTSWLIFSEDETEYLRRVKREAM